jgi:hypothetical protein
VNVAEGMEEDEDDEGWSGQQNPVTNLMLYSRQAWVMSSVDGQKAHIFPIFRSGRVREGMRSFGFSVNCTCAATGTRIGSQVEMFNENYSIS